MNSRGQERTWPGQLQASRVLFVASPGPFVAWRGLERTWRVLLLASRGEEQTWRVLFRAWGGLERKGLGRSPGRSAGIPPPHGVLTEMGEGSPGRASTRGDRGPRRQLNPWKIFDLPELVTASHK